MKATIGSEIRRIQATGQPGMLTAPGGFPLALVRPDDTPETVLDQLRFTLPMAQTAAYRYGQHQIIAGYAGDLDCARSPLGQKG
jgi:hypothetical protein